VIVPKTRLASLVAFLVFLMLPARLPAAPAHSAASEGANAGLGPVLHYIASDWDVLTRSMSQCSSVVDPKLPQAAVLYLPAEFAEPTAVKELEESCKVRVLHLPAVIHHPGQIDPSDINPQGLLYLPNKYVVPGGRFNEMYGWDSYFILLGLVRDGRLDLARGIVENFLFEIEHYGTVLNANRTYYLSRSQPPFLTSMILAVYRAEKTAGHDDQQWLRHAYEIAAKDYGNWVRPPHLAGNTGLSRYYDYGDSPAPESLQDETGYYRQVAGYFLVHPELAATYLAGEGSRQRGAGSAYTVQVCEPATTMERPKCNTAGTVRLSTDYYRGDRSMRESGFDVSFRFGPYGAATHHFAPVGLNSLLYKTEKDLESMSRMLGKRAEAEKWKQRASTRKALINRYLWNANRSLFFDYNFETGAQSSYEYVTTFYPLWAGLATREQARAVVGNLKIFEQPGGLATSATKSGGQWDYPYGWAPLQVLAVEGMRRYGYNDDSNRVSFEFLSTVAQNFRREGTIREKYNVVTRSSEAQVTVGYHINVVGFGWTNGVFLQLLHELPQAMVEKLAKEQETPPPPLSSEYGLPSGWIGVPLGMRFFKRPAGCGIRGERTSAPCVPC
jgi:alpha,alpha-trehalase